MSPSNPNAGAGQRGSLCWQVAGAFCRCVLFVAIPLFVLVTLDIKFDLVSLLPFDTMHDIPTASGPCADHPIRDLALSSDGRTVWITRFPAHLQQLEIATGSVLASFASPVSFASNPQFTSSPHPAVVYACDAGLMVQPFDSASHIRDISLLKQQGYRANFAVNPVRDEIAFADREGIEVRSLTTMAMISQVHLPDNISRMLWSPDGMRLLVGSTEGTLFILDGITLATISQRPTFLTDNAKLLWSRQGQHVAAFSEVGAIVTWDLIRDATTSVKTAEQFLRTAALSPDGRCVAWVDAQDQVWLRFLGEHAEPQWLGVSGSIIHSLMFDAEGDSLLVGSTDCVLESWSLTDGAVEWSIRLRDDWQNASAPLNELRLKTGRSPDFMTTAGEQPPPLVHSVEQPVGRERAS